MTRAPDVTDLYTKLVANLQSLQRHAGECGDWTGTVRKRADDALALAAALWERCSLASMAHRSGRAVQKNSALVQVFGNPPATVFSYDVQAIAYRHRDDDQFYVHVFGPEGKQKARAEGLIEDDPFLGALPEETGVLMLATGNDVLLRHQEANTPLSRMF